MQSYNHLITLSSAMLAWRFSFYMSRSFPESVLIHVTDEISSGTAQGFSDLTPGLHILSSSTFLELLARFRSSPLHWRLSSPYFTPTDILTPSDEDYGNLVAFFSSYYLQGIPLPPLS
jgi:hypothetical protein